MKPPRKKNRNAERLHPEGIDGKRPGQMQTPAAPERTDDTPPGGPHEHSVEQGSPSTADVVTNQDEQAKITNAASDDQPLADK